MVFPILLLSSWPLADTKVFNNIRFSLLGFKTVQKPTNRLKNKHLEKQQKCRPPPAVGRPANPDPKVAGICLKCVIRFWSFLNRRSEKLRYFNTVADQLATDRCKCGKTLGVRSSDFNKLKNRRNT